MDFSTFFLKIPIIFLYTFEFYFVINSYYYDISIQYYEFYFAEFCDFFLFFKCMYAISFFFRETIFKIHTFYVMIPTKKEPNLKKEWILLHFKQYAVSQAKLSSLFSCLVYENNFV